jgi:hypothetical protein
MLDDRDNVKPEDRSNPDWWARAVGFAGLALAAFSIVHTWMTESRDRREHERAQYAACAVSAADSATLVMNSPLTDADGAYELSELKSHLGLLGVHSQAGVQNIELDGRDQMDLAGEIAIAVSPRMSRFFQLAYHCWFVVNIRHEHPKLEGAWAEGVKYQSTAAQQLAPEFGVRLPADTSKWLDVLEELRDRFAFGGGQTLPSYASQQLKFERDAGDSTTQPPHPTSARHRN